MTEPAEPLDVDVLTERLATAWWHWDGQPGDPVLTRRSNTALVAFEPLLQPLGLSWLDLVRAIQGHRRGDPDVAGVPGGHRQKVADAVQSAVNDLVPPQRSHDAQVLQPDPYEFKEAS